MAAAYQALERGTPFNRFVTIHWELADVPDAGAAGATGRFIKLASDWCRARGVLFLWMWVRENGDGKGSHVHMLLHIPAEHARAFAGMQRRWLRRITGKPYQRGVIRTERIGGTLRAAETVPEHYRANLGAVLGYVLKGALRDVARTMGLDRVEDAGTVIGKRAAWCQNLGECQKRAFRSCPSAGDVG